MFYSFVLKINTPKDIFLPPYTGHFTYASFLNTINEVNPTLAEQLYKQNIIKPFTISSLMGDFISFKNSILVSKNNNYYIRITILDSHLFSSIISILLDNKFKHINIGKNQFNVLKIIVTPKEHKYASFETWEDFWKSASNNNKDIVLKFMSPTTFKSGNKNYFLPIPEQVFKSIQKKFMIFTQKFLKEDPTLSKEFFSKNIRIARFENLSTNIIELKQGKQIGYTGKVHYQITNNDKFVIKYLNALANFSKYSGVGSKTTLGFGQTIRE